MTMDCHSVVFLAEVTLQATGTPPSPVTLRPTALGDRATTTTVPQAQPQPVGEGPPMLRPVLSVLRAAVGSRPRKSVARAPARRRVYLALELLEGRTVPAV